MDHRGGPWWIAEEVLVDHRGILGGSQRETSMYHGGDHGWITKGIIGGSQRGSSVDHRWSTEDFFG